jgi:membrane-bound serine protease (ClpP class)
MDWGALLSQAGPLGIALQVQPGGWSASLLSTGALLGGFLFWRSKARQRAEEAAQAAQEARQAIRSGRQQVRQMRHLAIRIPERDMRQEISEIANLASLILDALERDPGDVRRARRFLDYYLGAAVNLVERYAQLGEHRGADPEIAAAVARFGDLVDMMHTTFGEQHTRLLRDKAFEFEVDADVLRKMMDLDGL